MRTESEAVKELTVISPNDGGQSIIKKSKSSLTSFKAFFNLISLSGKGTSSISAPIKSMFEGIIFKKLNSVS